VSCRVVAVLSLASIVFVLRATPAHAAGADDLTRDDVVLRVGELESALSVEADVSKRAGGEPWSLAPDLSYGLTDALTVGIVHSARALSLVDSGLGLCLSGHDCRGIYDDATLDSRYRFLERDGFNLAARVRFTSHSFDPWKPSLRVGGLFKWHHGRFAVLTDPQLQLGLANRERGNRDWLRLPLWLEIQPMRHVLVALRTGVEGELATWHDTFLVAGALDLTVRIRPDVDGSLTVGFPALLGPLNDGNERHLGATVTVRWW
jgi:hypothetical protein